MDDILGKFFVIVFGMIFLAYVPVTVIALKQDNTSQTYIDNAVVEFVDNARASARISPDAYEKMVSKIYAVHSPCEIKIYHTAKYSVPYTESGGRYVVTGRTEEFTKSFILQAMYPDDLTANDYLLKEGDFIKVTVENETPTLGGRLAGILLPGYNKKTLFTSYGGYVGNSPQ